MENMTSPAAAFFWFSGIVDAPFIKNLKQFRKALFQQAPNKLDREGKSAYC